MRPVSTEHPIDQVLNGIAAARNLSRADAMKYLGIEQTVASRIRNDKMDPSPRVVLLIHLRTGKPVLDIYKMFGVVPI